MSAEPEWTTLASPDSSLDYWQWDEVEPPGRVFAVGPRASYELVASDSGLHVESVGEGEVPRWRSSVGEAHHDEGDLALDAHRLYVAHHDAISSGASVTALDLDTGRVVWSTVLEGLGPIDHSKYRNRVQLGLGVGPQALGPQRLSVYGWESSGRYTEVLDAATGTRVSNRQIDDELAGIERRPHRENLEFPDSASEHVLADAVYSFRELPATGDQAQHAIISREGTGGWTRTLPGDGRCGNAIVAEHADRIFVVRWCAIASGASLTVLEKKSGTPVLQRPLRALGPVAHSEYMNTVEMDFVAGHLVVFGSEAQGDYVEVVDPRSGQTRISRIFRGEI